MDIPLKQIWHIFTALDHLGFLAVQIIRLSISADIQRNDNVIIKVLLLRRVSAGYMTHADMSREIIHEFGNILRLETCIEATWRAYLSARPPDPQLHEAPLICNRTTFKCYIAFRSIPTSRHMSSSVLFTIHLFLMRGAQ